MQTVSLEVREFEVPLAQVNPDARLPKSLSIELSKESAAALQRVVGGLSARGDVTDSGRPVRSNHQAIVWMLEAIEKNERK